MKKKGLIISTVVMVVVLIAALTTATFAWFSSTTMAQIDTITMQADSQADLKIGVVPVATGFAYPTTIGDFLSGDIGWDADAWTGAGGMGPLITFDTETVKYTPAGKAVGLASDTVNSTINKGKFYTGNATSNSSELDEENAAAATAQTDYLDVTLGIMPAGNTVKQAYIHITVEATDPAKIGMAAAIHFAFRLKNGTTTDTETLLDPTTFKQYEEAKTFGDTNVGIFEAFPGLTYEQGWKNEGGVTYGVATGTKWEMWIEILPYQASAYSSVYSATNTDRNLALLEIMAWLDGDDDSCVTANTGTGGKITFQFESYDTEQEQTKIGVKPTAKV